MLSGREGLSRLVLTLTAKVGIGQIEKGGSEVLGKREDYGKGREVFKQEWLQARLTEELYLMDSSQDVHEFHPNHINKHIT